MASEHETRDEPDGSEEHESGGGENGPENDKVGLDRSDESQSFVDQSKMDFDPDDGLYSGTAVDGTSDIPDLEAGEDGAASGEGPADRDEAAEGDAEE